jgi:hypothetical protein
VLPVHSTEGVHLNGQPLAAGQVTDGQLRIDVPPGRHTLEAPYTR